TRSANTCYAQSADGIHWERPDLGMREWTDGSTKNNLIIRSALGVEGNAIPIQFGIDPGDPDPDRRYKMFIKDQLGGKALPNYVVGVAFSPDGIHWREHITEPYMTHNSRRGGIMNPDANYTHIGQGGDFDGTRKIRRNESDDFIQWSGSRIVIDRDLNDPPGTQFYGMFTDPVNSHTYAGLRFGLLQVYHTPPYGENRPQPFRYSTFPDIIDAELAVSRDSITWLRAGDRETFLPCGPEGSWDAGMVFSSYPLFREDKIFLFYSGNNYPHHGPPKGTEAARGIGMATLRKDGFVSVECDGSQPGWLMTRSFYPIHVHQSKDLRAEAFCVQTSAIAVNADAEGGELRAEILNHQGSVVPNYSAEDSDPICEDVFDAKLSWKGESDLSVLRDQLEDRNDADQKFRLRFHLSGKTKLYSFELLE
ncbi:MAG: hypothetical protein QF886_18850, partial [Planctomycetota bacterium]|nr:hypothetical protein [Planctomycetota bacterium]